VVISQPQEDLTKTSREVENGGILLHVDEPLEPISYIWRFQKKKEKTRNLPKSFKNLGSFETFFLQMWRLFENFLKLP
jgi:hypothetical protein